MPLIAKIKQFYEKADRGYKHLYNAVMFSCEHMTDLASEGLDRKLTLRERVTRRLHLKLCTWCRRYEAQLNFLRTNARNYAEKYPDRSSEKLSEDTARLIREHIRKETRKSL